jgi:hypothetical protein
MSTKQINPENIRLEGEIMDERTVEDGARKLIYGMEQSDQAVMEWGWDDMDEYTVIDGDEGYWIGPVERQGTGFGYARPVDEENDEVAYWLENAEDNTMDELASEPVEWRYQIATTILPHDIADDPVEFMEIGRDLAKENGAYAIAKVYSSDALGI